MSYIHIGRWISSLLELFVLWLLQWSVIPHLGLSSWISLVPEPQNTKIRPLSNTSMAPLSSSEKKSFKSLTSNQNLKMIYLSEEGMLKAFMG